MKKDSFKIILLILVLVIIEVIVISNDKLVFSNRVIIENAENPKDPNWEYVKDRLFDGESEYVYKNNRRTNNAPILINIKEATKEDSLAVEEIFKELRVVLPHKTIDYFENFTGESYSDILNSQIDQPKIYEKGTNGYLSYSVIQMSFGGLSGSFRSGVLTSLLLDGSMIERNVFKVDENIISALRHINFSLKSTISFDVRKKLIQYELLRALCYVQPTNLVSYNYLQKGVYYTPDYAPEYAMFNEKDKFLLQKLYSNDFLEQFKEYLYANYPWRYANHFVNKKRIEIQAWVAIVPLGLLAFVLLFGLFQNRKFKYSYFDYFFPIMSIVVCAYHFIQIHSYFTNMDSTNAMTEFFYGMIFYILGAAIVSFVLWISEMLERKYMREDVNFSFQLLLKVVTTFLAFNLPIIISLLLGKLYSNWLEFYFPLLIFAFVMAFGRGFLIYLNHFSDSLIKEKDVELSRLKELNAQNELKSLHAHINPHFLYNALNSIASLVYENPKKTEEMTISLSDLFKYSINRKGEKMSTIANEVEMVENYLKIEKIRFEERLNFSIDVEEGLLEKEIPMYVLQPLIENAIKHGISKIDVDGKIELVLKMEDDKLLITVSDNGPDFPDGLLCGHGLQSVYDLLRLSYGELATMNWENTPEKRIVISIASKK